MSEQAKRGRKPKGDKAMTGAERQRALRARQKAAKQKDTYLVMDENDLQALSGIAQAYGTTKTVLMGGILGGALKRLQELDKVFSDAVAKGMSEKQIGRYRSEALYLVYTGKSLQSLSNRIIEDLAESIRLTPKEDAELAEMLSEMTPEEVAELEAKTDELLRGETCQANTQR